MLGGCIFRHGVEVSFADGHSWISSIWFMIVYFVAPVCVGVVDLYSICPAASFPSELSWQFRGSANWKTWHGSDTSWLRDTIGVIVCCSVVTPTGIFTMGRPRQNTLLSGWWRILHLGIHRFISIQDQSGIHFSNVSQGRHFTLRLFRSRAGPFFFSVIAGWGQTDDESAGPLITMKFPDTKVEEYRKFGP